MLHYADIGLQASSRIIATYAIFTLGLPCCTWTAYVTLEASSELATIVLEGI